MLLLEDWGTEERASNAFKQERSSLLNWQPKTTVETLLRLVSVAELSPLPRKYITSEVTLTRFTFVFVYCTTCIMGAGALLCVLNRSSTVQTMGVFHNCLTIVAEKGQ